jgi:hypothetical protein
MICSLQIEIEPEWAEDRVHPTVPDIFRVRRTCEFFSYSWFRGILRGSKSDMSSDMEDEKNLPRFFEELFRVLLLLVVQMNHS